VPLWVNNRLAGQWLMRQLCPRNLPRWSPVGAAEKGQQPTSYDRLCREELAAASKCTQPTCCLHFEQGAVAEHSSPITAVPLISTTMPGNARWLIVTNELAG
jgi:hypothetical protein